MIVAAINARLERVGDCTLWWPGLPVLGIGRPPETGREVLADKSEVGCRLVLKRVDRLLESGWIGGVSVGPAMPVVQGDGEAVESFGLSVVSVEVDELAGRGEGGFDVADLVGCSAVFGEDGLESRVEAFLSGDSGVVVPVGLVDHVAG